MPAKPRITLKMLEKLDACPSQRDKFQALFGASVVVTIPLAVQHADIFDWGWAADKFLTYHGAAAWRAGREPLADVYCTALAAAEGAYDAAMAPARDAPSAAVKASLAFALAQEARPIYDAARAAARKAYCEVLAELFAEAFIKHHSN